jgi:hypothetical protein
MFFSLTVPLPSCHSDHSGYKRYIGHRFNASRSQSHIIARRVLTVECRLHLPPRLPDSSPWRTSRCLRCHPVLQAIMTVLNAVRQESPRQTARHDLMGRCIIEFARGRYSILRTALSGHRSKDKQPISLPAAPSDHSHASHLPTFRRQTASGHTYSAGPKLTPRTWQRLIVAWRRLWRHSPMRHHYMYTTICLSRASRLDFC